MLKNVRSLLCNILCLLCHCLVALQLFGSDVPAAFSASKKEHGAEEVTIQAKEQQKDGSLYTLKGDVEIDFRNYLLKADEITYDSDSGIATATGHVELQGGDEDVVIQGSHATYNLHTEMGKFFDVLGTAGLDYHGGTRVTLRTENPFVFRGKEVDKIGQKHYLLLEGMVTSCLLPDPKWSFRSGRVEFTLGGTAKIYNSTFRIRDIPVLYLPYAQHPAEAIGRQTGFLVPTIGQSSRKGFILGDSFYWAISRSMDTTLGAEYFSSRGWAQHGEFRARPDADSKIDITYFGVLDRGFATRVNGQPVLQNQGGEDVKGTGTARLPWGFHGGFSAEFLSRFLFREAWTENFSQAVDSEVKSVAFASRPTNGYDFSVFARRYQNFQSVAPDDVIQILHTPGLEFSSVDRKLMGPLYLGFDLAAEGVARSQPPVVNSGLEGLRTDGLVSRFDAHPHFTVPVFLQGWTFRPELGLRDTFYSQQLRPNADVGVTTDDPINRRDLEASFELRPPTLVKVFDKPLFGRKIKHTIEPRVIYRYVNGISNFNQIIRFDERDIASNTNEVEYGVIQRIYTHRIAPAKGCENQANMTDVEKEEAGCLGGQEFISWELAQKYYFDPTFGGAVVNGIRNVFTTSEQLTGIAFITGPRRVSPIISRLRVHTTGKSQLEWALDFDPKTNQLTSSNTVLNYKFNQITLGASHTYLRTPGEVFTLTNNLVVPAVFNQYRLLAGYGSPSKRGLSFAGNVGVDAVFSTFQYEAAQTSYNWDCCGVSFEYRRFGLGAVRNENQYRFAFSLANIGTFGNLRRQERLF